MSAKFHCPTGVRGVFLGNTKGKKASLWISDKDVIAVNETGHFVLLTFPVCELKKEVELHRAIKEICE